MVAIATGSMLWTATATVNAAAREDVSPPLHATVSITNATGQSIILRVMYSYQRNSDGPSKPRPRGESAIFANVKIPKNTTRPLQIFAEDRFKNRLPLNEILVINDEHEEKIVVEETEEAPILPPEIRGRGNYEKGKK